MKEEAEETEPCMICKGDIDLNNDNYVHVEDYKEGEFYTDGYYHNVCYHQALHKKTLDTLQKNVLEKLASFSGGIPYA